MMQLTWSGTSKQIEALRLAQQRLTDLSPATKVGAEIMKKLIDDSFRLQRDPWGGAWKSFSPNTLKARRKGRGKGSAKLLIDTGVLRNSISAVGEPQAIVFGSIYEGRRNANGAEVAGYGRAQQFGTAHIPARPFLPVKDGRFEAPPGTPAGRALAKIRRVIVQYIIKGQSIPEAAE